MNDRIPSPLTNRHSLLQAEQHAFFLQRIFRVYPNEVKLLLWVTAIQIVMRLSGILINNFAQTAFIKRFGVEHLPMVFVIEAILTFFFASAVGVLMERHRTLRVFTGLLFFFALSVGVIRLFLPLGIPLIYPILFILKSQAVEILPILYWDILSDLFTTQQSKRLYTLITAGGVLGTTLGSFMTGKVAHWVGVDNVLLIFVGGMILSALLNEFTESVVGAPLEPRTDRRKGKAQGSFRDNLRRFTGFARQTPLLRYMILIIAIPNMVLPILTYQFNVVVDSYYATEQGTLQFFGIFRGVSNAVMFGILLFSGRLVTRWGVPTSLLFHPVNYLIALGSLLFRFDMVSAIYARFTTETLKTTLNNPARAVLYNFFPPQMRALVRVFLRGNVVRAADFLGSGLLMLIKGFFDPRFLSVVAAPLVMIWIYTTVRIKKNYSSMVVQSLMARQIDWNRLEDVDFQAWVRDKKTLDRLQEGLKAENPDMVMICGEILARAEPPLWARWIVGALAGKPPATQGFLLGLLKPQDREQIWQELLLFAEKASPDTLTYLIPALSRLDPKASLPVIDKSLAHPDVRVRVEALAGLYRSMESHALASFRARIQELLEVGQDGIRMSLAVLAKTGDPSFSKILLRYAKDQDPDLKAWALSGLGEMRHAEALEIALTSLEEPSRQVRRAAVNALYALKDKAPLDVWIRLLGDEDPVHREKASLAIRERGQDTVQALLPALASPSRVMREKVLSILSDLGAPSVELSHFVTAQIQRAYLHLAFLKVLKANEGDKAVTLLQEHLLEKNDEILELVLRVLGVLEFGGHMKIILTALQSSDKRERDDAVEALESALHSDIRKILIPLLGDSPLEEKLGIGRKRMAIHVPASERPEKTLSALVGNEDPVTQTLALYALGEQSLERSVRNSISASLESTNPMVREAADWILRERALDRLAEEPPFQKPSLIDKALFIRKIPIFKELRVRELIAISCMSTEKRSSQNEIVVREGDPGDSLYLIMKGGAVVIKGVDAGKETVLDQMESDDFFGEMALIDQKPRSATIKTKSDTLFLVIPGDDFTRMLEENPSISLNISRVLIRRMKTLQGLLQQTRGPRGLPFTRRQL